MAPLARPPVVTAEDVEPLVQSTSFGCAPISCATWLRASSTAASAVQPNAWLRDPVDAETIRTASKSNRMVSFPYPKLMNSNNAVDMSAAIIVASVEKAKALGVPESQWVYPWTGTDAHDTYFVANRDNLYSSPAIRLAGSRALELAGLGVGDLDHVDVYSCFPSAVQVAVEELGLPVDRPLTVTGGLTPMCPCSAT